MGCALLEDGAVSCWGYNEFGQVGNGTKGGSSSPGPVSPLHDVIDIVAGDIHVCALLADRTVSCWGNNSHGQLGDGSKTHRSSPTPVPGLVNVMQISLGVTHTCALQGDGALLCWGDEFAYVKDMVPSDPYVGRVSPTRIAF